MRGKALYTSSVILSFFVGVIATILVVGNSNLLNKQTEVIEKVVSEVTITESNTIKSSVDKIYDAVVLIETYKGNRSQGTGTGFVYKKDEKNGYVMTNNHVIDGATKIVVIYNNGQEVEATLLGGDEYADLAVLSVDVASVSSVATLGKSEEAEVGDTIFTVGSPLGREYMGTVTKGILSGKNRTVEVDISTGNFLMEVLQMDAAINPGNSGGPLVNINGEVIGINSLKLVKDEVEGMGFAIPVEIAMTSVEKLEKGEAVLRPLIGVELIDATSTYELYRNNIVLNETLENGVVLVSTVKDFPANKSGLQKGDVILEVNGTQITGIGHFRFVLYKYTVGDTIKVKYYRDGNISEVDLLLDKSVEDGQ